MTSAAAIIRQKIFKIQNEIDFNECALELFFYQAEHVAVYKEYLRLIKISPSYINHFTDIPHLPVTLFKSFIVTDQLITPELFFTSSGTTGQTSSKHYVADKEIYDESLLKSFMHFYGKPSQYCFLALLPSYLERSGSSLVYMMEKLIKSGHELGGFFLYNHEELHSRISELEKKGINIFLAGVTYALLDFFQNYPASDYKGIIMETGGMKGTRKELIKEEVHQLLIKNSGCKKIHSEYGMTELLSQSYSKGDGIFSTPPWMKIAITDIHDPFNRVNDRETGLINVTDLANIHSCAFIQTQDLGRMTGNDFEVLGRIDSSELRGCNLMID